MNLYLLCNYSLLAVLNEIYGIVSALPLEKGFGLLAPKPPTCYISNWRDGLKLILELQKKGR